MTRIVRIAADDPSVRAMFTPAELAKMKRQGKVKGAVKPKPTDLGDTLAGQLRITGISGWVREYQFHDTRKWRIDVAFPANLLAIECEGFSRGGTAGRHQRPQGFMQDCEKYAALAIAGWRLIRAERTQINDYTCLGWVQAYIAERKAEGTWKGL